MTRCCILIFLSLSLFSCRFENVLIRHPDGETKVKEIYIIDRNGLSVRSVKYSRKGDVTDSVYFDRHSEITRSAVFNNGKMIHLSVSPNPPYGYLQYFYPDGKIQEQGGIYIFKRHGGWVSYDPDGRIQTYAYFEKGRDLFSTVYNTEGVSDSLKGNAIYQTVLLSDTILDPGQFFVKTFYLVNPPECDVSFFFAPSDTADSISVPVKNAMATVSFQPAECKRYILKYSWLISDNTGKHIGWGKQSQSITVRAKDEQFVTE